MIFYFYKKLNKILIILIIFIITTTIVLYLNINPINCDEWPKGLNNTYIENNINKYGCQIKIPKFCPYKIGTYFQDITKIKGTKCINRKKNARKNINI